MFNCIDIYSFIPVSGCLGRGPTALLFPGAYYAIKTALVISTLPCKIAEQVVNYYIVNTLVSIAS